MVKENTHTIINSKGHLSENSIAECADWLNDPDKKLDPILREHLEKCAECKAEVLEVAELASLEDLPEDDYRDKFEETCAAKYSPSIKPASKTQVWKVAAVILVLISITVLALLVKPAKVDTEFAEDGNPESSIEQLEDNQKVELDSDEQDEPEISNEINELVKDKFAANFIPDHGLEGLIGVKYRAANGPTLYSPPLDTVMLKSGYILFKGENPEGEKLDIQLLNNRGELLNHYQEITELKIIVETPADPGLYYWKLSGTEELYIVGKITIKDDQNN